MGELNDITTHQKQRHYRTEYGIAAIIKVTVFTRVHSLTKKFKHSKKHMQEKCYVRHQ